MEKTTDYMAYDVDYSSDPTVDVCLNCTAETCPGTCIRAARIAAGLGDPGPKYDGVRFMRKGYTKETLRRIAADYGITTAVVSRAAFFTLDETDLRSYLDRQYGRSDAAARSAAALDRHDRRRMVERLVDITGTSVTTINRRLREGMTCDEIRAHYAAVARGRARRYTVERLVDITGTSITTVNRCLKKGMSYDEICAHYATHPPRRKKKQAA